MTDTPETTRNQLRAFVERIERAEAEKQERADDVRDIYSEAKSSGYEPKIIRKVVALRRLDENDRAEQEAIMDMYLAALNMLPADIASGEIG